MDSIPFSERMLSAMERIASALERLTPGHLPLGDQTTNDATLYGPREAATELKMNEQTVRKYCRQRVFGTLGKNRRWIISGVEIRTFREGQKRIHGRGVA
jgi:hypothetical protein